MTDELCNVCGWRRDQHPLRGCHFEPSGTFASTHVDGPESPWKNATMTCAVCSTEWVATYPDSVPTLECPKCGHHNQLPEIHP